MPLYSKAPEPRPLPVLIQPAPAQRFVPLGYFGVTAALDLSHAGEGRTVRFAASADGPDDDQPPDIPPTLPPLPDVPSTPPANGADEPPSLPPTPPADNSAGGDNSQASDDGDGGDDDMDDPPDTPPSAGDAATDGKDLDEEFAGQNSTPGIQPQDLLVIAKDLLSINADQSDHVDGHMNTAKPKFNCSLFVALFVQKVAGDSALVGKTANQQFDYMSQNWTEVSDTDKAKDLAAQGKVVVVAWQNPDPAHSGHVVIVVPGDGCTVRGGWYPNVAGGDITGNYWSDGGRCVRGKTNSETVFGRRKIPQLKYFTP